MKINAIRRFDKYLGVPICFLLTLLRYISGVFNHRKQSCNQPSRKILFIKLIEQGATVIAKSAI
jgi:hypothetical protein